MYNDYFNFSCSPFENTLDQRFLFLSETHAEVVASLLYFIQEKKSFALVCGDVGTGKTMIIHHILSRLLPSVQPILIPYPDVEYMDILRYIARVLKIKPEGKGILDLTDEVKAVLTKPGLAGKQFVLIIDEAHLLPVSSLENIRLLSNIEVTENKLLQILLIGQNELSHKLRRREMRQLLQRINVNRFLSPMSPSETIEYIDYRLLVAGSDFDRCFEPACKKRIYKMTGGVPRSINRLCDTALLICMSEKGDKVTRKIIKKAHDALHSDVILAPKESKPGRSFSIKKLKPALAGGALVLLLALGFLGYKENLGENLKVWIYGPDSPKAVNTYVQKPLPPVPEVKREEIPKPPEAEVKSEEIAKPTATEVKSEEIAKPAVPEVKSEEIAKPAVPEVKSEEIAKPAEGDERTAPGGMSAMVASPQPPAPSQEPPESVSKEEEPAASAGVRGMKIDEAPPSAEESGPNPAPPEETQVPPDETQAKDQIPNANSGSTESKGGDAGREITSGSENPNVDVHSLKTGSKPPRLFSAFKITVQKGDTLRGIAAEWFPEDPAAGEKSILSANPWIGDKNWILVGQILRIPLHKETD